VRAERRASGAATVLDTAEGELTRVPVPCPAGGHYPTYADAQTAALRAALPTGRIEAPVVHAHTGFLAGVVAARLARPDARLVVTEHATFLPKVFGQPGARRAYARMLDRAHVLLCVGGYLRDQLRDYFPEHAGKLAVLPNAIDFDRFVVRAAPPRAPLRWIYIGRMMAHKGVLPLLDAFALVAAEDPRVTLTLVGDGPLAGEVDARIAELGLGGRAVRRPPVPPEQVVPLLHDHDLLVHASMLETFGMTVVEAVATGTPVLVARSQGPAETLAGLADSAGQLFEPTDDPHVIAEGYRKLRARFDDLDLAGARADLTARYGTDAVGARLLAAYTAGETGVHAPMPAEHRTGATARYAKRVYLRLRG
jgi:glycogen(starch) synthase